MSDPQPIQYVLSPGELTRCRRIAEKRFHSSSTKSVVNQRKALDRTDEEIDYLGVRAEWAFARVMGLDPNTIDGDYADGGYDFQLNDKTVDIKATFQSSSNLLVKSKAAAKADLFVLITGTHHEWLMNIVGGASRKRLLENGQPAEKVTGRRGGIVLPQRQLSTPQSVWRWINQHRNNACRILWEARDVSQ